MPENCVDIPSCFMVQSDLIMPMFEEIQLLKDVDDLRRAIVLFRRWDDISCIVGLNGPILKWSAYDETFVGIVYLF